MAMESKQGGGLWTRIRHQYGTASAALSQLSISSSEHDGETENDTVVHHALVRFYQNRDGQVPSWLGPTPEQNSVHRPAFMQSHSTTSAAPTRPGDGVHRSTTARGGSALQDIYKRREQRQQQFQGQGMQQPGGPAPAAAVAASGASPMSAPRPPQRSHTFNGHDSVGSNGGAGGQPPQRQDRFRNKLKSAGRANW